MKNLLKKLIAGVMVTALLITSFIIPASAAGSQKFTVKYTDGSPVKLMEDTTVIYGNNTRLRKSVYGNDECVFIGWKATRVINGKYETLYNTGWHTGAEFEAAKNRGEHWEADLYKDQAQIACTTPVPNGIVIMQAVCERRYYTVNYLRNGGKGTMPQTKVYYGCDTPLAKNTFTRTGYTFKGWTASRKSLDNNTAQYLYVTKSGNQWHTSAEATAAKAKGENWTLAIYKDQASVACTTYAHQGSVYMTAEWAKN